MEIIAKIKELVAKKKSLTAGLTIGVAMLAAYCNIISGREAVTVIVGALGVLAATLGLEDVGKAKEEVAVKALGKAKK